MRKLFITLAVLACGATAANAQYSTEGNCQKYTFKTLSEIEGSGVTYDGVYTVTEDLEIAATDTLELDPGAVVRIAAKKTIDIAGYGLFTPAVPSVITKIDGEDAPRGIKISGEGVGVFSNVTFEYAAIYNVCDNPLTVENCTFRYVTSAQNSTGAIAFAGQSSGSVVRNCSFLSNNIPAIGSGATNYIGIAIEGNLIYDNNTDNSNKPMINLTTPAENGPTIIRNNTIIGTGRNMVGGISVSNLVGAPLGDVIIDGNSVSNCRYGFNLFGPIKFEVRNNRLVNNRYETNPNNGGSGITVYDTTGKLEAVMSGNYIEGCLWGITLVGPGAGFKSVNLGEPSSTDINSPGDNVFKNNGNDGKNWEYTEHPYDLYNNSTATVYAQHNIWSVPEQTEEQIERVIFHKADNPALGEVIFMSPDNAVAAAVRDENVAFDASSRALTSSACIERLNVCDASGKAMLNVNPGATMYTLPYLAPGVYVISGITATGTFSFKASF